MNASEKFIAALRFEKPEGLPLPCLFYAFHPETVRRWQQEGLPRDVHLVEHLGLERCDLVPVNVGPLPHYESVGLENIEEWRLGMDRSIGASVEEGIRNVEEQFPIRDSASSSAFGRMLNPISPARYPRFWDDYVRQVRDRTYTLGVCVGSPLSWLAEWTGLAQLTSEANSLPSYTKGLIESIPKFITSTLERALHDIDLDFALFVEPRAYRLVNALSHQQLIDTCDSMYRPLISWVKEMGIRLVGVQASGCVEGLLDKWVGAGVNFMSLEVSGGFDLGGLRERFGDKVAFIGNIDHRVLAWGKRDIAEEVKMKMVAFEQGGYIPAPDQIVMPDVSWENIKYFMELLKAYCS